MIELKEYWDIEAKLERQTHLKYDKKLIITIKNHAPVQRMFRIKLVGCKFKDQQNALHFKMYSGLDSPIHVEVDKYKKRTVEIDLPKLVNPDDAELQFEIEKVETGEKKTLIVKL